MLGAERPQGIARELPRDQLAVGVDDVRKLGVDEVEAGAALDRAAQLGGAGDAEHRHRAYPDEAQSEPERHPVFQGKRIP